MGSGGRARSGNGSDLSVLASSVTAAWILAEEKQQSCGALPSCSAHVRGVTEGWLGLSHTVATWAWVERRPANQADKRTIVVWSKGIAVEKTLCV